MVTQLTESFVCENQFSQQKKGNIVSGIFQKADVRNVNGRLYKYALWEKILNRPDIKAAIKERRMLGELGHPDCVETTAVNVSHIVTKLELLPNGNVYGEAEILDTPSGRILKTLYEAGVKMGISSRGFLPEGSNLYPEGKDMVVPDDYELVTFDFVIDPSTPGANPTVKESVKTKLAGILTEGRSRVNSDIASYIETLSAASNKAVRTVKKVGGMKVLSEAKSTPSSSDKFKISDEEAQSSMENQKYVEKLQAIISELRSRYLMAEAVIKELSAGPKMADSILQDISMRYLTSEGVIKELRDYALKLEQTLTDVTKAYQVSEAVIGDLRDRYTISEAALKDIIAKYKLSEKVIDELKRRYTISEGVIKELVSRCTSSKSTVKDGLTTESEIKDLKARCQLSEEVIADMAERLKTPAKKKTPIPEGYFEDVAGKYGISISEAKKIFKELGCRKSAFEYHLEERKKFMSKPYGEYPYMISEAPTSNVYLSEGKTETEEDRIARIVSQSL